MEILQVCFLLYFIKCLHAEVHFIVTPNDQVVVSENANFTVTCIAEEEDTSEKNPPDAYFMAGNKKIVTTEDKHIVVNTTNIGLKTIVQLNISRIKLNDLNDPKNLLYCKTKNSAYQMSLYILPENNVPQFINGTSAVLSAEQGSDLSFTCGIKFNSTYKVDIEWGFKNQNGKPELNVKSVKSETSSDLTISNVQLINGGKYYCVVKLILPDGVSQNYVKIFELAEITSQMKHNSKELIVKAGADTTLVCDIIGFPEPKYTWKKSDAVIDNSTDRRYLFRKGNSSVLPNWTFTITDVTYTDRAVYQCIASFNKSQVVKYFTLRVRDPLNALWPAVGILVEAVLLAIIIFSCEFCKGKRMEIRGSKKDANEETSPLVGNTPIKVSYSGAEESVRMRTSKEALA